MHYDKHLYDILTAWTSDRLGREPGLDDIRVESMHLIAGLPEAGWPQELLAEAVQDDTGSLMADDDLARRIEYVTADDLNRAIQDRLAGLPELCMQMGLGVR